VRDAQKEAIVDKELMDMGVKSPQTISADADLDYEQEQKNIEEHNKKHQPPGGPGGPAPPGGIKLISIYILRIYS
jgi:hypothetical protein